MYGSSINESSVFKVWYDSISDIERAAVSVLDDCWMMQLVFVMGTNNVTCLKMNFF